MNFLSVFYKIQRNKTKCELCRDGIILFDSKNVWNVKNECWRLSWMHLSKTNFKCLYSTFKQREFFTCETWKFGSLQESVWLKHKMSKNSCLFQATLVVSVRTCGCSCTFHKVKTLHVFLQKHERAAAWMAPCHISVWFVSASAEEVKFIWSIKGNLSNEVTTHVMWNWSDSGFVHRRHFTELSYKSPVNVNRTITRVHLIISTCAFSSAYLSQSEQEQGECLWAQMYLLWSLRRRSEL